MYTFLFRGYWQNKKKKTLLLAKCVFYNPFSDMRKSIFQKDHLSGLFQELKKKKKPRISKSRADFKSKPDYV